MEEVLRAVLGSVAVMAVVALLLLPPKVKTVVVEKPREEAFELIRLYPSADPPEYELRAPTDDEWAQFVEVKFRKFLKGVPQEPENATVSWRDHSDLFDQLAVVDDNDSASGAIFKNRREAEVFKYQALAAFGHGYWDGVEGPVHDKRVDIVFEAPERYPEARVRVGRPKKPADAVE
jgi:hypothetical protein